MATHSTDVHERGSNRLTSSWESFCREEAKQWASAFLERVRSFKLRNAVAREVQDSTFTNEFSAAFLEESSLLLGGGGNSGMLSHANGEAAGLTRSLPSAHVHSATRAPSQGEPSPKKSSKKSWFSHLFKWSKSQRNRRSSTPNIRQARIRPNTRVIKDEQVRMLNLNSDDSSSVFAWQPCRLSLIEENENHQLEVYTPPKSTMPKMSLFCFLIQEVRPATSLEIPDSTSCIVIKSQNHGEYVFDVGSESRQQNWISSIKSHSANLAPSSNGHLPAYGAVSVGMRGRSYSIGATEHHRSSLSTTVTPSHTNHVHLAESRLAPPPPDMANSNESVLIDVAPFIRNCPNHSPSRRVQSMFLESNLTSNIAHTGGNTQATSTLQRSGFPYDSPDPSPPPIPKRGLRPKNVAIVNSSPANEAKPSSPSTPAARSLSKGNTPLRRMSQPHIELYNASTPELPSNLDTCSMSSSSSALHPVTLADIERRGPLSPSHLRYSSQLSILSEGHGASLAAPSTSRIRKISAPVLPLQPFLNREIVHPEPNPSPITKNRSTDNFLPSPLGHHDNDQSQSNGTSNNEEAALMLHNRDEDMSAKATLSFPLNSRSDSPNSQSRLSDEDTRVDTQTDVQRGVVPYTRLNVSSLANRTQYRNESTTERSHSQASNNTEESDDQTSQPLYIETTDNDNVNQSSTHTQHPYENWATRQQDVENLRQLSQFPWFHGMISRQNASQLVCEEGEAGSGQFLMRQSESREGDFVLTFNYHNRAKHLRLTLNENGCSIQHLWFDDVSSMLEYFKSNSIPLESFWLNNDVKLTTFIDRKKSDAFRTTTVVNVTRLNRVPPRRSRSLHLSMSQAVSNSTDTPHPLDRSISSGSSSNTSMNSLPQSGRNAVGLRQLFRSQRSSSAGNMSVHGVRSGVGVQRRHSTNAGSILDARGRGNGSGRNGQNTYVYRNY